MMDENDYSDNDNVDIAEDLHNDEDVEANIEEDVEANIEEDVEANIEEDVEANIEEDDEEVEEDNVDNNDEDDEDEYVKNETIKPKHKNKIKNNKVNIIYTSDGLSENNYHKSNVANEELVRAECCHNYFKKHAYIHQTQYKLGIQGINMCIHCFISLNIHKFAECKNLTGAEEECLKYYINTFTKNHSSELCNKIRLHGKCLLCEAKIGIKHKIFTPQESIEYIESNFGTSNDSKSVTVSDVVLIDAISNNSHIIVL
jgi:hypothetical protein